MKQHSPFKNVRMIYLYTMLICESSKKKLLLKVITNRILQKRLVNWLLLVKKKSYNPNIILCLSYTKITLKLSRKHSTYYHTIKTLVAL
jgi:hypothetical protein